jgi:hypothetical protein
MESERVEREVSPLHLLPQGVELLQHRLVRDAPALGVLDDGADPQQ